MTFDLVVTIIMHFYATKRDVSNFRFAKKGDSSSQVRLSHRGGRLWLFFGGSKFLISIFVGVFRKLNIFVGMKILWIFFGGSSQNWTIFRGHFYAF